MYEHLAKLDEYLFREHGIHITTLSIPRLEYLMFGTNPPALQPVKTARL